MKTTAGYYQHLKPKYHLTPKHNWINDPNGPIYWNGQYHMFFQHNPLKSVWGNIHWGHAVSKNMVHWKILEPALKPGPETYDLKGVLSGSSILHNNDLHIFYTACEPQTQCLAKWVKSPDGGYFEKYKGNPVILSPPEEYSTKDFRDPFVWRDKNDFKMLLSSNVKNRYGVVLLYSSEDLHNWKYIKEFYREKLKKNAATFECPLYFKLDGLEILVISPFNSPFYLIGETRNNSFIPKKRGLLDANPYWYAPNTFLTTDNRRIMIAWIIEESGEIYQGKAEWNGALSMPREVYALPDGDIGVKPVIEMNLLRADSIPIPPAIIKTGAREELPNTPWSGEIELTIKTEGKAEMELRLFEDPESEHFYSIRVDKNWAVLSDMLNEPDSGFHVSEKQINFDAGDDEINLRIFIDHSIIEVFINERYGLSSRLYPETENNTGASVTARRGDISIIKGAVYKFIDNPIEY